MMHVIFTVVWTIFAFMCNDRDMSQTAIICSQIWIATALLTKKGS